MKEETVVGSNPKKSVVLILTLAGGLFFLAALGDLASLFGTAQAYRLHHEATTPLAFMLAKVLVGLVFGVGAATVWGSSEKMGLRPSYDLPALVFTAVLLVAVGYVLRNEAFFTLYDNKELSVHPTEVVMAPWAGWMTRSAHAIICALGIAGGALYCRLSGAKRKNRND